ncbi:dihydroorotase [Flavobacteriaceae bacterium 14752]|uniref:dihydroorotase n=1 Tax=Mesohalobacter salilacus TaxID=2491711 RepID=UPI000F62EBA7|nr:dihydroorotase [Flavobacteriaceae bacterium 14752]
MKNYIIIFLALSLFTKINSYAQNSNLNFDEGEVFTIAEVSDNNYEYINFPKPNFIIKKGGIPDFKTLKGKKVEIASIKKNKVGTLIANIRLTSRASFFNSHKYVEVSIEDAIKNGELIKE